jgi:hypothetical protein
MSGLFIESATLEGIHWNSGIFVHFLESHKQLKKLHLNSVSTEIFERNHLDRINFDGLEELFVEEIEFEEPKDLQNFCGFLRKLRSLRHLKLYITINLTLLKVILNELPMLKTLDFGPTQIQPIPELNKLRKNFQIGNFVIASFNAEPTIKTLLPLLLNLKNANVPEFPIELLPDYMRVLSKNDPKLDIHWIRIKILKFWALLFFSILSFFLSALLLLPYS